jgi:glycosyltransferase involved in cell wall biosynthesis
MVARALTVVQMLPELQSGGVERGTLELGKYLVHHGHRSIVISGGGRLVAQLESEGSEHVLWDVGKKSLLTLKYIPGLRKFLARQDVDILHLRSRVPAWVGYLAWKSMPAQSRPRLVTTFHGFYSVNRYSAVMAKGEKIIAISKVIEDHIKNTYKVPKDRIVLIHRGVDTAIFDPEKVGADRLQSLQSEWSILPLDVPLVMLPGRVTALKGHDIFLRSLAAIKDLNWLAVCVGECDKTSAHVKHIFSLLQELHLDKRVLFVEHCVDMPAAYLLADIVVSASSSKAEAFGRIAIEAQAMERPVIATAHGGSIETIIDRQTGWLVKPGDYNDLAKALREALSNKITAKQYGANGRKWIREKFTVGKMCDKTVSLYYDLVKNRHSV